MKLGANASGAGGGGNATIGGSGGTKMSVPGGAGGPVDNADGTKLVGGSGGGNGGGFATALCTDPTRGRGGVGGGAAGRVFFGTRGAAPMTIGGSTIAALRFDFAF